MEHQGPNQDFQQVEQQNMMDLKKITDEAYQYLQTNNMAPPAILLNRIEQAVISYEQYKPIASQLAENGFPNLMNQLNVCLADCNRAKGIYQNMIVDQNAIQNKINQIHRDTSQFAFDTIQQVIKRRQDAMDSAFNKYIEYNRQSGSAPQATQSTNDSTWKCSAVCPQRLGDTYCGKTCQLNAGHYGPHICPDGHQWR